MARDQNRLVNSCDEDTKRSRRHGCLEDKLHTYTGQRAHGHCQSGLTALTTMAVPDPLQRHSQRGGAKLVPPKRSSRPRRSIAGAAGEGHQLFLRNCIGEGRGRLPIDDSQGVQFIKNVVPLFRRARSCTSWLDSAEAAARVTPSSCWHSGGRLKKSFMAADSRASCTWSSSLVKPWAHASSRNIFTVAMTTAELEWLSLSSRTFMKSYTSCSSEGR
ncbi:MAG: hypothetical protein FRX49_00665 [Trebouxia sp. A1-2]|nr:MAG: hypothetical protein FRX49_00665 [Trebouxia sp. A1-2]